METEGFVCRNCLHFNKNCQDLLKYRCKDKEKHRFESNDAKVFVRWNGTYLEPSVRQLPKSVSLKPGQKIVLCTGGKKCTLDQCSYAHNREELKRFNEELKKRQPAGINISPMTDFPVSYPGQLPPPVPGGGLHQQFPVNGFPPPPVNGFPPTMLNGLHRCTPPIFLPTPPHNVRRFPHSSPIQPCPPAAHVVWPTNHEEATQHEEEEYAASKEDFGERVKQDLDEREIQVVLSRANYKRKYHNLICWEEKKHIEVLDTKCDGQYSLEIFRPGSEPRWIMSRDVNHSYHGVISGIVPDKIAYATQASEAAFIVDKTTTSETFEVRCEILPANYAHTDDKLYVAFSSENLKKLSELLAVEPQAIYSRQPVCVEFEVNHFFFNNLVKAVSSLKEHTISRIVPASCHEFPQPRETLFDYENQIIDRLIVDGDEHKHVLKRIACCQVSSSPPVLVSGPFGTGKTRLLALAAHFFIELGRQTGQRTCVLMVAHHQASADTLFESYYCINSEIRITAGLKSVVRITSNRYRLHEPKFQPYYKTFWEFRNQYGRQLGNLQLIVSTFQTSLRLCSLRPDLFTHILLDEGAQAWEPEAIAPLALASRHTQIVIAGDSYQVGPSLLVLGEKSRENGLKYSLLERLKTKYDEIGQTASHYNLTLNVNHRCHVDILPIPKKLFYGDMKSSPKAVPSHPAAPNPLMFVCSGISSQQPNADTDHLEAELLLTEVMKFVSSSKWPRIVWGPYDPGKVAIVSSTRTQVVITRNCARSQFTQFRRARILTTYEIQGQEFQALFVSTTEPLSEDGNTCNPTKSPCDPFVFNTMLTRAKSLIVVVGNPNTLLGIERHMVVKYGPRAKCWSNYLNQCLSNGTFLVPPRVEESHEKRRMFERELTARVQSMIASPAKSTSTHTMKPPNTSTQAEKAPTPRVVSTPSPAFSSYPSTATSKTSVPIRVTGNKPARAISVSSSKACVFEIGGTIPDAKKKPNPVRTDKVSATGAANTRPGGNVPGRIAKIAASRLAANSVHLRPEKPASASKESLSKGKGTPPASRKQASPAKKAVPVSGASPQTKKRPTTQLKDSTNFYAPLTKQSAPRRAEVPKGWKKGGVGKGRSQAASKDQYNADFPELGEGAKRRQPKRDFKKLSQQHHVPAKKDYTMDSHSESYERFKDQLCLESIKCELTRENYKQKFHHLLCWEEKEHSNMLKRYNGKYKVVLFKIENLPYWDKDFVRYGYINCRDGDNNDAEKLSYSKQAGEGSFLILDQKTVVHAKHVQNRKLPRAADHNAIAIGFTEEQNQLLIKWNRSCRGDFQFPNYVTVEFELKFSYFERLHKAVEGLSQHVVDRIMPINQYMVSNQDYEERDDIRFFSPYERLQLDGTCQFQALKMILISNSQCPLLVAGPFGTGKTRLVARAAFELLRDRSNNVLICAHHQASADTFVEHFGSIREDPVRPWYTKFVRVAPKEIRGSIKDRYSEHFRTVGQVNRGRPYRLVVTTLGLAPFLAGSYSHGYFTHILIDEGAQTREPETVGPLCLANENTKIIIAGDHCQVGPRLLVFGEEAQTNGLGTSIMERLYKVYEAFPETTKSLHSELSTNYRCHRGILMLPSHLFYESTLLCRSNAPAHPRAHYPLVFVCSSLDKCNIARGSTDYLEADCLLDYVEKYVTEWPSSWGEPSLDTICIMSPSDNQCSLLKKKLSNKKKLRGIEILKAYDMQGREYRAIFISTAEVTDDSGKPRNQTKTLCDRFVFNTAITRSQSLVVAVGNPYTLLHSEDNVGDNYNFDDNPRCWSHYLQRCFESNSFHLHENLDRTSDIQQSILTLKDYVYSRCKDKDDTPFSSVDGTTETKKDAILEAYRSVFKNSNTFKNAHLKLSSEGKNVLSWNIKEGDNGQPTRAQTIEVDSDENYIETYQCVLRMESFGKGEAISVDSRKEIVKIRGFNNRRGAFDGDTVEVGIFDDNPDDKNYGKVTKVIERGNEQVYLCSVRKNATCFFPINRADPLFINLPFLTRRLLEAKDKNSVQEHLRSTEDVVVFDPRSVDGCVESQDLPKIKTVIPISVARHMLFLVRFIKWDLSYRNPLGAVIEALPKGLTLYNAERLLKLQYNINFAETEDVDLPKSIEGSRHSVDNFAFTVDPVEAMFLDDAVSLKLLPSTDQATQVFELGVHIINVAKHVIEGSKIDRIAHQRGTSVYPGNARTLSAKHMLPSSFREKLSLNPGRQQHVLSGIATVSVCTQDQTVTVVGEPKLKEAIIESLLKLSYGDAQQIMDGDFQDQSKLSGITDYKRHNQITTQDAMKVLYLIASHLRKERLRNDSCYVYDVSDPGEEHCWQTHMLIEELMIWVNSLVATRLHSCYPDSTLLRRQGYPNMQTKAAVVLSHKTVLGFSHSLSQHLPQNSESVSPYFLLPASLVKELSDVATSGNVPHLINMLTSNRVFPQLAVVETQLRHSYVGAEYCCTKEDTDVNEYRHYSLNLPHYTHFSSPLRRYVDIIAQRMLTGTLARATVGQLPVFPREEHIKVCQFLNRKTRNAKKYEKQISMVHLATDLTVTSKVYEAFVCSTERGNVEMTFPSLQLKNLRSKDCTFHTQHLGPLKGESNNVYSISMKMTSLNEELGAFVLNYPALVNIHKTTTGQGGAASQLRSEQMSVQFKLQTASENNTLEVTRYSAEKQPGIVSIPSTDWAKCMEFVKDPSNAEKLANVRGCLVKLPHPTEQTHTNDIPKLCPITHCKLQFNLKPYEVFKVWLTWTAKDAFISPTIQLIELAPFARVCVQHNRHPADCFSDPNLSYASRKVYTNLQVYVELWEKVVLAEAAESSAKDCSLSILHDVKLDWPELYIPTNCVDEKYYLPKGRVSFTLPSLFLEHSSELFKINVGDLICARYGIESSSPTRSVFHLVVCGTEDTKNSKQDKEMIVYLKIVGKSNCRISEQMKKVLGEPCELQVITLSTSFQRVYSGLLNLLPPQKKDNKDRVYTSKQFARPPSCLAKDVAQGKVQLNKTGSVLLRDVSDIVKAEHNAIHLWKEGRPIRLNNGQENAIRSASYAFRLIQGPPGTGKSETGAHLAYIFARLNRNAEVSFGNCVLYCGPSNKAVDVVLEKLHKLCTLHKTLDIKILRIYGKTTESKVVADPGQPGKFDDKDAGYEQEEWTKQYSLHHIIRQNKYSLVCQKEQKFANLPKGKVPNGIELNQYRRAVKKAEQYVLQEEKFDVIFCTCNEAASARVQKYVYPNQVIIDESGMATEPETIIPVSTCEHVVVIGDHKQLQPVIDYPAARENGLPISLFERYAENFEGFTSVLNTQYRMHEEICRFPSEHFYHGELKTDVSVKNRRNPECSLQNFWPNPKGHDCPILFCDVVGKESEHKPGSHKGHRGVDSKLTQGEGHPGNRRTRTVNTGSKFNLDDARKTVEILCVLHHLYNVEQDQLAVLTPYSSQEVCIRALADNAGLKKVTVTTIIKSQGDEYGFVILSTVRSQPLDEIANPDHVQPDQSWLRENLGFVTDAHQINVGITRSKYGLIIVGNRRLLEYDKQTWEPLINHYDDRGCITPGNLFPDKRTVEDCTKRFVKIV